MHNRRQFLTAVLPACTFACMGLGSLWASARSPGNSQDESKKHKFQIEWTHTYEEAFNWRYRYYINLMKKFGEYLGRNKLLTMIKRATDEYILADPEYDAKFDFSQYMQAGKEYFKNMMTWEILEETDRVYEIKVSECLWTKIFKEYDATDIGFATVCYSDFASAKAAHPKLRLERTKTLMEGYGCCNHRWILDIP